MQVAFGRVRRKTEPTGLGEKVELPIYFLKLHTGILLISLNVYSVENVLDELRFRCLTCETFN